MIVVRQPRPAPAPRRGVAVVPAHLGLPPTLRRAGSARPTSATHWRIGPQLRPPRPGRRQAHVLRVESYDLMRRNASSPRPPRRRHASGSRPTRCGSSARSSTRSTSAASPTATTTASGDFRGLTEKLDYLQWLGVDCIWLLPMYPSPLRDGGYDIADFYDDPPRLRHGRGRPRASSRRRTQRGIRVIADLVMNHTSTDHPWFQESRSSPDSPEARLVRLVGHRRPLPGRADHLHRHRDLELDLGPGRRRVLLAPLLLPPARPQLRQPRGAGRDARRAALLARPRPRRLPARRRALPVRARRARTARTCPRRTST